MTKWLRYIVVVCVFVALIFVFYVTHGFGTYFVESIVKFSKGPPEIAQKSPFVKYVLIWTSPTSDPIVYMGKGNETFYKRHCSYTNCYVTSSRDALEISDFDAIVFHGPEIVKKTLDYFPKERSADQSYVFASMESSHYYGVPDTRYDGVFNFTWTYKLDSDIMYGYIIIRDKEDKVIGPNATVPWMSIDDMRPINDTVKAKLTDKSIAAAWFVSNCQSRSKREKVAEMVAAELKKYNMTVDIYGGCGKLKCPRDSMDKCLQKIQRDYYFYFSFENSFSEDYVTEKLLHALQNYAVPIVYGGADYRRFMPDGIYLNVTKNQESVVELVKQMVESIRDKDKYYEYFKWHNHYSYHTNTETPDTDPYCSFCSLLNNINQSHVVEDFRGWWNPHRKYKRSILTHLKHFEQKYIAVP